MFVRGLDNANKGGRSMSINKLWRFVYDAIRQRAEAGLEKPTADLYADKQHCHFADYRDNLLAKMSPKVYDAFAKGSGNELQGKMAAVYSSSAMTFNIFGNGPVEVKKNTCGWSVGKYTLQYERQLPVLKRGGKANLDAQLIDGKEIIFFEMKMQEWLFYKPSRLVRAYLHDEARYYNREMFSVVKTLIKEIMNKSASDDKSYSCRYKHFDAFQIIKHIIGIYNGVAGKKDEFAKAKKITLVVGDWTIPISVVKDMPADLQKIYKDIELEMQKETADFQKRLSDIQAMFTAKNVSFSVEFRTVKEILSCLGKEEDKAGKRYLQGIRM